MKNALTLSGEKILLMGLFLTPFTSLRLGFLGPGEILILIAALVGFLSTGMVIRLDKRMQIFYRFWSIFIIISILGLYYNHFLLSVSSGKPQSMIFDLFSYFFILLTILVIGHYASNKSNFSETFFRKLFIYWGIAYVTLFAISFFTPSIFGMPLRYHEYFSPLVRNLHQASMITMAMTFVMLYLGIKTPQLFNKILFFTGMALFATMAITSGSTKALLGIVVGFLICFVHLIGYRPTGRGRFYINTTTFFVTTALIMVFLFSYSDELIFLAIQFFTENDGANGSRQSIYKLGFEHGIKSPLVGYGPGSHVPYRQSFWDAHNSTLTLFLQTGLIGVLFFVWFNIRMLTKLSVHFALFGAMTAIGMYILGGDILRRLPIWIILIGLFYFAVYQPWQSGRLQQKSNNQNK